MKYLVILITLLLPFSNQAGELQLHGKHLAGQSLMIALYNSAADFPSEEKVFRWIKVKAASDSETASFQNLPSGKYAAAAFVDENSNEKLDKNFVGVPTELYGFSNDAIGRFSSPSFNEAEFNVSDGKVAQSIFLH